MSFQVLDNLVNSSIESLKRVEELTKKHVKFYQVDLVCRKPLVRSRSNRRARLSTRIRWKMSFRNTKSTQLFILLVSMHGEKFLTWILMSLH